MKAVVVKVRKGEAAVLREDGTVEVIRRDCRAGETIELAEKVTAFLPKRQRRVRRLAAAAAAAVRALGIGGA